MVGEKRSVIIVGASAAGLRCAARLKRLRPDLQVTVIEQREAFSYGACGLPYVLSGDIGDVEALHQTADGAVRDATYFARVKGVEILAGWRADTVDAEARTLRITRQDGDEQILNWDELVLATGAEPVRLPGQPDHPRVVCFHTPDDLKPLHQGLARGQIEHAVLIGAGFLGCELAEAFTALWGAEVTLLEAAETPLPGLLDPETGTIVAQELIRNDVHLRTGSRVASIEPDDAQVMVKTSGGDSISADVAVVAIGVKPSVELARQAGCELGTTGAVIVDDRLATTVPHVWAAGDVAELKQIVTDQAAYLPLGSLANRQGRTLANILAGREDSFPPVAGAGALKVFDLNVAATGVTRTAAGDKASSVWISAHDTADYWPESEEIFLQLTYRTDNRQVLGVQAVGKGEVAKRADTASQLLLRSAKLADFGRLEQAYSPPYAPALEPLAVAAMVAENACDGLQPLSPLDKLNGQLVLDVRHVDEAEARPLDLPAATHIPQEDLRDRVSDLMPGAWLVICERGTRSAEVVRLLEAGGFSAQYLGGGWRWREMSGV